MRLNLPIFGGFRPFGVLPEAVAILHGSYF